MREEDWAFLKRFLLASGSLKDLAKAYGVSYPTIRQRLDRLIEKVQLHDRAVEMAPFERHLRGLLIDGRLDSEAFRLISAAHREALAEAGAPARPAGEPVPPLQPDEQHHENNRQEPGGSGCDYQPA